MNNQVTVFDNTEFGKLGTVAVDSVVYFVGKDVAEILGYLLQKKYFDIKFSDYDGCGHKVIC